MLAQKCHFQEFCVYLTVNEDFNYLEDKDHLLWSEDLVYGNWEDGPYRDGSHQKTLSVLVPESVQENGTWYLHVFIAKTGHTIDSDDKNYTEQAITYQSTCKGVGGESGLTTLLTWDIRIPDSVVPIATLHWYWVRLTLNPLCFNLKGQFL